MIRITLRIMESSHPLQGTRRLVSAPSTTDNVPRAEARPVPWSSEQLFAGRTEIEINHGPHVYRLRQTSLGKLILTK